VCSAGNLATFMIPDTGCLLEPSRPVQACTALLYLPHFNESILFKATCKCTQVGLSGKRMRKKRGVDITLVPSVQRAAIVPTVLKSRSLNLQEPSRPVQACIEIDLPYSKADCTLELDGMVAQEGKDKGRATSKVNMTTRRHKEGQVQEERVSRIIIVRQSWRGRKEERHCTYHHPFSDVFMSRI
jgi:hypothetical protein